MPDDRPASSAALKRSRIKRDKRWDDGGVVHEITKTDERMIFTRCGIASKQGCIVRGVPTTCMACLSDSPVLSSVLL